MLIIALIIFGPKRLPELGKSLGNGIREFKGSISGESDDDEEPREIDSSAEEASPARGDGTTRSEDTARVETAESGGAARTETAPADDASGTGETAPTRSSS